MLWSYLAYHGTEILSHDCTGDRRDQKTLERLRAERRAKIDELKERTNYYTTQQLIQVMISQILIAFAPSSP